MAATVNPAAATTLTNQLGALAARRAQDEMQGLSNLPANKAFAMAVMLWWFDKLAATHFWLSALLSACFVVNTFWAEVVVAIAIVPEVTESLLWRLAEFHYTPERMKSALYNKLMPDHT